MKNHSEEESAEGRVTSPMQSFNGRQAGIGVVVLLVGLGIAYLIPTVL